MRRPCGGVAQNLDSKPEDKTAERILGVRMHVALQYSLTRLVAFMSGERETERVSLPPHGRCGKLTDRADACDQIAEAAFICGIHNI